MQMACRRRGTACTKHRSDITGSKRKMYRQKGTGNARKGSVKSPILVGGGVAFGPKPRDYSYKLPKKVVRQALISALSQKFKEGKVLVLDNLKLPEIKTKNVVKHLNKLEASSALIIENQENDNLWMSARNVPDIKVLPPVALNLYDILSYEKLVFTRETFTKVQEVYGS